MVHYMKLFVSSLDQMPLYVIIGDSDLRKETENHNLCQTPCTQVTLGRIFVERRDRMNFPMS